MTRRDAVVLFAGIGGADSGLVEAGLQHALSVELVAERVRLLHSVGLCSLAADLSRLDSWAHRAPRQPWLLWASPPCQDWSTAGLRAGAGGNRNGWPWTWAAVDELRPRWLVCETVRGILQHRTRSGCSRGARPRPDTCPGCYWTHRILPAARERYAWVEVWQINAADHGVPQHRRRVFLVAGPRPAAPPPATHSAEALAVAKWRTGLYWQRHGLQPVGHPTAAEQRLLAAAPLTMRAGIAAPLQPWRTVYDALPGIHAEALLRSGGPGRANADRPIHIPAPTVPACDGNLYLSRADGQQARRRLQPDECAALQDLPTWWPLHRLPTMREAYAAVGNAVPRTVAKRLAEQLLLADHDHTGVTRP